MNNYNYKLPNHDISFSFKGSGNVVVLGFVYTMAAGVLKPKAVPIPAELASVIMTALVCNLYIFS